MFVGDEVQLNVSFAVARKRLMSLAEAGALLGPSEDAYDHEAEGLTRVGIPGLSKLVRVQIRDLASTEESVGLAIRWEASGPGGGLFPVLDADIRLARAGARAAVLAVAGVYRPPLGPLGQALDRAILHRAAAATIRGFVIQVAASLADQPTGCTAFQDEPGPCPGPSSPELNA
jgi:hypothetical protein